MLPGFWDAVLRGRHKCLSSNNAGVGSGHSAGWVLAEKVAGVGGIPCGSSNLERKQGLFPAVDYWSFPLDYLITESDIFESAGKQMTL